MKRKVVAIIPVRELHKTKLRLAKSLTRSQRAALTFSLLYHVLAALEHSKVDATVIVASHVRSIYQLAKKFPKAIVINEKRHHGGVTKAMKDGMARARHLFPDVTSFMLLPSDLPFLSGGAIDDAISKLSRRDLVISPSMRRDGTSLLLFNSPGGEIPLHYDDDSYKKHLKEAKMLKIKYSIIPRKELSFDLDSTRDLQRLMRNLGTESMQELSQKLQDTM